MKHFVPVRRRKIKYRGESRSQEIFEETQVEFAQAEQNDSNISPVSNDKTVLDATESIATANVPTASNTTWECMQTQICGRLTI